MAGEDAKAMSKEIKKMIEQNYAEITKEVDLESSTILENLRAKMVLEGNESEWITNPYIHTTKEKRVGALLDTIIKKGPIGFHIFCESLEFPYPRLFKLLTGKDPVLPEGIGQLNRNSITISAQQQFFSWEDIHNFHKKFEALNKECVFMKERNAIMQKENENLKKKYEEATKMLTTVKWKMQFCENMRLKNKQLEADLFHLNNQSKQYLHQTFEAQKQVDALEKQLKENTDENENLKIELSEVKSEVKRQKTQTKRLNHDLEKVQNVDPSGIDGLKKEIDKLRMDIQSIRKNRDDIRTRDELTSANPDDHRVAMLHEQVENLIQDKEELVDDLYKVRNECIKVEKERDRCVGRMDLLSYRNSVLKQNMEILKGRREQLFNKLEEVEKERNQAIFDRDRAQEESNNRLVQRERIYHELVDYQRRCDNLKEEVEEITNQIAEKNLKVDYLENQTEEGSFRSCSFRESNYHETSGQNSDNIRSNFSGFKDILPDDTTGDPLHSPSISSTLAHVSNSFKKRDADDPELPEHQRNSATSSSERESSDSYSLVQTLDDMDKRSSIYFFSDFSEFNNDNLPPLVHSYSPSQESKQMLRRSRSFSSLNFDFKKFKEENISHIPVKESNEPADENAHTHRAIIESKSFLSEITIKGGNVTGFFLTSIKETPSTTSAGLLVGDQLLFVVGNIMGKQTKKDMQDMTSDKFHKLMANTSGKLTIGIRRNNFSGFERLERNIEKGIKMYSGDHFYIRVVGKIKPPKHRDYTLNIKYGMILHVTNTWYDCFPGYWYAFLVDKYCQDIQTGGSIPDKERAIQLCKQTDLRSLSFKSGKQNPCSPTVASGLSSSFKWSRQLLNPSGFFHLDSEAYAIVEPKDPNYTRPVLIIGPTIVVNSVQINLTTNLKYKHSYAYFETELSNSYEGDDVIEWQREGAMFEVTTISAIKQANKSSERKHFLLNIQLENVIKLYNAGIYPIIIYLKPDRDRNYKSFLRLLQDNDSETKLKKLKDVKEWEEKYYSILNDEFYPDYYNEIDLKDVHRKGIDYLVEQVNSTIQEKNSLTIWVTRPPESSA